MRKHMFLEVTVIGACFGLSCIECAVGASCVLDEFYTATPGRNAILDNTPFSCVWHMIHVFFLARQMPHYAYLIAFSNDSYLLW